eukprot:ANDGO_03818.mRNA.1 hypothetical protein
MASIDYWLPTSSNACETASPALDCHPSSLRKRTAESPVLWGEFSDVIKRLVLSQNRINRLHLQLHVLHYANNIRNKTEIAALHRQVSQLKSITQSQSWYNHLYELILVTACAILAMKWTTPWTLRLAALCFILWYARHRMHTFAPLVSTVAQRLPFW